MIQVNRQQAVYLFQEACLFMFFSYLILLGGTFNGLVLYSLNVINLALVFAIGFFWILIRSLKKRKFPRTGLDLGITSVILAAVVSTVFSYDPRRSLIELIILSVTALIFYCLVDLIRQGLPIQLINKVLILVSGFIVFFGLRELFIWYRGWINIVGFQNLIPPATIRIRAFLGHPNFVAAFFNLLIPVSLGILFAKKHKRLKVVLGFYIAAAFVLVFFTSSRGGWLGTISAVGTFALFWSLAKRELLKERLSQILKRRWIIAGLSLVLILAFIILIFLLRWQSNHPSHPSDWSNIQSSRDYIWTVAWNMFLNNPITGNGLFTYGSEYLRVESIPPNLLLTHAHNYYLNFAAEAGIIGIISLAVFLSSMIVVFREAWSNHDNLSKIELAGLFGAIVGLGIHSLFETPQMMPVLMVLPAVYLAQIASYEPEHKSRTRDKYWPANIILVVIWVCVVCSMAWDVRAFSFFEKGVQLANQEDWEDSVKYIEKANQLDPRNAFYRFQAAFAYSNLALDDKGEVQNNSALEKALDAYREGFSLEPDYSVNWMNQGLLQWANGEREQAILSANNAVDKSSRQADFFLTLGRMYEVSGNEQDAILAYMNALEINPFWAQDPYFKETTSRVKAVAKMEDETVDLVSIDDNYLLQGWDYFDRELYSNALEAFVIAQGFNSPENYWARGKTHFHLKNYKEADLAYRTALWMRSNDGRLLSNIYLDRGELAYTQGLCQDAIDYYSQALSLLNRTTSYGIGKMGTSEYGWYLFYKPSIAVDLLPGMENLIISDEVIEGMHNLGRCYLETHQVDLAEEIYKEILKYQPNDAIALNQLLQLSDEP